MMATRVHWHGTQQESNDLVNAMARNCACEFDKQGARVETCAAHDALLHDQRFVDGLIWERRLRECRIREEWSA